MGAWLTSIDLKEAYWHVPIARSFQKYLAFALTTGNYCFRAMPFGLNVAPRVFTKLCAVLVKDLRERGILVFAYLDDWLVVAKSIQEAKTATNKVLSTLAKAGFIINQPKSNLTPTQVLEWLGLTWDTQSATVLFPLSKVQKIKSMVRGFLSRQTCTRRDLERVAGHLNWMSMLNPESRVRLKSLNHVQSSLSRRFGRDQIISITSDIRTALAWWTNITPSPWMRPFKTPEASLIVTTDASKTGWGFHTSEGQEGQGLWSPFWAARHINLLEFLAVYLALKAVRLPPHSMVLVRSDNSTVVNCLRRGGSPRSVPLNQMTLAVVRLVEKRGWFLDQSHVSGNYNVRADLLSRGVPIATEWTLDLASLQSLWKLMSTLPQVDLFATPSNHCLDVFVSPISMEGAWSTDALSLDWNEWKAIYLLTPH